MKVEKNQNEIIFDKEVSFFSYDLRSENIKHLTKEQKDKIANIRVKIWYKIRYYYKLRPINMSLYLIPDKNIIPKLKVDMEKWILEYSSFNLKPLMNIITIKTDNIGYSTFREMEKAFLMEWLSEIIDNIEKTQKKGKMNKQKIAVYNKKLQLIEDIVNEDFKNDNEINDMLFMAFDSIQNIKLNGGKK